MSVAAKSSAHRNRIRLSRGYKVFSVTNVFLLTMLAALCVLPLIHLIAVSFSGQAASASNSVRFWPIDFNLNAYVRMFDDGLLLGSFFVTLKRMALGAAYSLLITVLAAYPLSFSSRIFPGRKVYVVFFFISMLFSGGIIPFYMLINNLKLMNSIWALVLGGVPVANVIILLNFFRQLPGTIYESAVIDGASHMRVLWQIYIPLSMPAIATLTLFNLVGIWNEWFYGMVFMKEPAKYPLQTYLWAMVNNKDTFIDLGAAGAAYSASRQSIIAAVTCFAMLPVLIAYPLLQKYVKTGLVLGSVKE
jgi:putative aldouronate transport system permease protein